MSLLALALPSLTLPTRAALEFAGVMTSERALRFLLIDQDTKGTSGWLSIGESFSGHSIVAFDEKNDLLFLLSTKGEVRLPLKASRVKSSKGAPKRIARTQEKMARENTIFMVIAPNGTIEDLEGMKKRLTELRPTLRDVVFTHMQLPENAPTDGKQYQEFVLPAMISFDAACSKMGLRHAGGQIDPPPSRQKP